jgi:hypothetical protein
VDNENSDAAEWKTPQRLKADLALALEMVLDFENFYLPRRVFPVPNVAPTPFKIRSFPLYINELRDSKAPIHHTSRRATKDIHYI